MPIRPFLSGQALEPETIRAISLAFEEACEDLGFSPFVDEQATRLVASKTIELAQRGIRDHAELVRRTLEDLK